MLRAALKGNLQGNKHFDCPKCGDSFTSQGGHANKVKRKACCSYEERFWFKVNKTDGCWLWLGFLNHDGYGRVGPRRGVHTGARAHKVAWEMRHGPVPDGLEVMHICDTRACVRPDHLRLGTHQENMKDCLAKDRHARGERNRWAKLRDEDIPLIRSLEGQYSQRAIAAVYGVTQATIAQIFNGETWKHIK